VDECVWQTATMLQFPNEVNAPRLRNFASCPDSSCSVEFAAALILTGYF
jgi:hypothetical protein